MRQNFINKDSASLLTYPKDYLTKSIEFGQLTNAMQNYELRSSQIFDHQMKARKQSTAVIGQEIACRLVIYKLR